VTKLCIFVGTTAVGTLFGFLASPYGLMTEVIASGVGSVLGVYLGWKFAQWIEQRM